MLTKNQNMPQYIDLQIACKDKVPFDDGLLTSWIETALNAHDSQCELTLRLVDIAEITELNNTYRKQNKATNVLAFPSSFPDNIPLELPFLGDLIVCPAVLEKEALEQGTPLDAHWAHILIHGVLHLLGYDHILDDEAKEMQAEEIRLLASLGFKNPYPQEEDEQIEPS